MLLFAEADVSLLDFPKEKKTEIWQCGSADVGVSSRFILLAVQKGTLSLSLFRLPNPVIHGRTGQIKSQ